jgi:branched-chain amino acid aminotransferase
LKINTLLSLYIFFKITQKTESHLMNQNIPKSIIDALKNYKLPDNLGFGLHFAPVMVKSDYSDGNWSPLEVLPYAPIPLDPAAKVLHYAQEIFEGMKAYKNEDDEVYLFRPEQNARRFNRSAHRMAMPEYPEADFIEANRLITDLCRDLIPTQIGASLYLRPFMIATEGALGVRPSSTYSFYVIASPAGNYFSKGSVTVYVEREAARASEGGTGYAKAGGNYAASLRSFLKLKEVGADQTLWLDAKHHRYVEELSGMNFFAVIDGEFHTPALTDTILEGITRKSILQYAKDQGHKIQERKINIDELLVEIQSGKCTEAFACGTASVLTPIGRIIDQGQSYDLAYPEGQLSIDIKLDLLMIQSGRLHKMPQWVLKV